MADTKGKGIDLAVIFGGKPKMAKDKMGSSDKEESVDPAVESAAVEAFPEFEDDPDRLKAFVRAIRACCESYESEETPDESESDEG